MNLFKKVEKLAKKMKWYDISLLKGTVFFFTLFLVTAWAEFRNLVLGVHWTWYLMLSIIFMIPLLKKMFSK
ncbi:hypothetical protein HOM13_01890 [Candidatus Woesearchaeota archaeon]|jgi:hypothetical protein|nr:hypothetical protein [Candidatus Woesearchaeota archaeon]MBT5215464.1 hypothetical protein [Candidatus Woesearchaeota archaeon]